MKMPTDPNSIMLGIIGIVIGGFLAKVAIAAIRRERCCRRFARYFGGLLGTLRFQSSHQKVDGDCGDYSFSWNLDNDAEAQADTQGEMITEEDESGRKMMVKDEESDVRVELSVYPATKRIYLAHWDNNLSEHDKRFSRFGTYALAMALQRIQRDYCSTHKSSTDSVDAGNGTNKWRISLIPSGCRGDLPISGLFELYYSFGFTRRDYDDRVAELDQPAGFVGNFSTVLGRVNLQGQRCRFFAQFGFNFPDKLQLR